MPTTLLREPTKPPPPPLLDEDPAVYSQHLSSIAGPSTKADNPSMTSGSALQFKFEKKYCKTRQECGAVDWSVATRYALAMLNVKNYRNICIQKLKSNK
jgi:hypothetical protein